jgi:hypothetical protein
MIHPSPRTTTMFLRWQSNGYDKTVEEQVVTIADESIAENHHW